MRPAVNAALCGLIGFVALVCFAMAAHRSIAYVLAMLAGIWLIHLALLRAHWQHWANLWLAASSASRLA